RARARVGVPQPRRRGRGGGRGGRRRGRGRRRTRAREPARERWRERQERGGDMTRALLLAKREIGSLLRSPVGYVVAAAALLIEGIYFYAFGLGEERLLSAGVLAMFFEGASGTTMILSALLAMRLLAAERESGTIVLLNTAPIREVE